MPAIMFARGLVSKEWSMKLSESTRNRCQTDKSRCARWGANGFQSQRTDICCEHTIAFCQPVNLMSPNCDFHAAPAEADVGMMSLLFRQLSDSVYKSKRLLEVTLFVYLVEMMFSYYCPFLDLTQEPLNLIALQRRDAAATR